MDTELAGEIPIPAGIMAGDGNSLGFVKPFILSAVTLASAFLFAILLRYSGLSGRAPKAPDQDPRTHIPL